jgi:hypothetical protein
VDTSALVAAFAGSESVDTSPEMAGLPDQGRWTPAVGTLPVLPSIRLGERGHAPKPSSLQIAADGLSAHTRRLLDA